MDRRKRIVFLTGTRADFGKIKSLIATLRERPDQFQVHVFATGMHLEPKYGYTIQEIEKCKFGVEIYPFINQSSQGVLDRTLANTVIGFGDYVRLRKPDLIVVHGDRSEALAGALVGAINNILVAHIEGGEVSGTIDELIRHSVSKMSHLHFVSNDEAKRRLIQLGEHARSIFVIGSPDVDLMSSPDLPTLEEVKAHYEIPFDGHGVLVWHPVTTSPASLAYETREVVTAACDSFENWVVIYPNSDPGSDLILAEYERAFRSNPRTRLFPSLRFEAMLVLLREARVVLGNSSMGIGEAPYYGTPTIDVGTRQAGRSENPHLVRVDADRHAILAALSRVSGTRVPRTHLERGDGQSHLRFRNLLLDPALFETPVQKRFVDLSHADLEPVDRRRSAA
jgi:UDP-N-acetylglucosamine 2-epimerase (hydrolysing)